MYLRLWKWKPPPPPPKYQNSRQCECGRKNLFTVEVVFESVQRMKQSRSFARPFFSSEVWRTCRNDRCRIMKDMSFFCHCLGLHSILFSTRLSGWPRDTSQTTAKINIDTFYIYSCFLELFLSAALSINQHWPRVWCSINTTAHAQTRTRDGRSISGCFQTSSLTLWMRDNPSKNKIRVCFNRVFTLRVY